MIVDVLYDWAPAILIGLVLAAVGAGVAARAVILTQLQADALSSTQRNVSDALRDALLRQSRAAAWGLGAGRSRNNCSDRWDPNCCVDSPHQRVTSSGHSGQVVWIWVVHTGDGWGEPVYLCRRGGQCAPVS